MFNAFSYEAQAFNGAKLSTHRNKSDLWTALYIFQDTTEPVPSPEKRRVGVRKGIRP